MTCNPKFDDLPAPEVRLERSLVSKSSTPDSRGEEKGDMKDEEKGNVVDKGVHIDKKAPKIDGKSEYERSREANIARNNELLRQVEERVPMEPFQKGDKKKGDGQERKTKKKEKVHQEPRRSSARIQGIR